MLTQDLPDMSLIKVFLEWVQEWYPQKYKTVLLLKFRNLNIEIYGNRKYMKI